MIQGAFNVSSKVLTKQIQSSIFRDNRIQDRSKKIVVTCSLGLCLELEVNYSKIWALRMLSLDDGGVEKWIEDGYKLEKSNN